MLPLAICVLTLAPAQTGVPTDAQRVVRTPLEPAELQALARKVLANDVQSGTIQKLIEEAKQNPAALIEKLKTIPPELVPAPLRKQFEQITKPETPTITPKDPPKDPFDGVTKSGESRFDPQPSMRAQPATNPQTNPPVRNPGLNNAIQKNPALQNALKIWEKNFGSIDRTPQLKKAISDLINSSVNAHDDSAKQGTAGGLDALLNSETEIGKEVAGWLEQAANNQPWNFDDLNIGDWKISLGDVSNGGINSSSLPTSFDAPDSTSLGTLLLMAAALAGLGYLLYWLRHRGTPDEAIATEARLARLDPASIADRATLVRVFEEITIDTLGRAARTWNHSTIAVAWQQRFQVTAEDAGAAAAWYEAARYTPPQEPLPAEILADARQWYGRFRGAVVR